MNILINLISSFRSSVEFLDSHSGSMLVLLTAVYVVGTLLMWFEMRQTRLKTEESNIQVTLEPQARWGNFFDLVIANIGNTPVYDLKISMEPKGLKTLGDRKLDDINLFKRNIPVFGKGQTLSTFAISYVDFINSEQQKQITFTADYKTGNGKKRTQAFDFDLEVYKNMSASSESSLGDVVAEMKNVTKKLDKISQHFEKKDLKEEISAKKTDTSL